MNKTKIIVDSCADISGELLKKYDIDYVKMNTVYQGKETPASLFWEYFSPKTMYDIIRNNKERVITTTQVPTEEFVNCFKKYFEAGYDDIIYVACSSKQSGSVNTGAVVAKELQKDYPEKNVYCIDSLNSSMGEGLLGIYAAQLLSEGKPAKEIAETVTAKRNCVNQYITVNTLEYLRRAGRVKGSAAFFGNLLGVKPILISDADGVQTPVKKVKGRMNSLNELIAMAKASYVDTENQTLYVVHADCAQEELDYFINKVKAEIPCKGVEVSYIGPIVGASIGPDAIGLFAFGKEVTYKVGEAK